MSQWCLNCSNGMCNCWLYGNWNLYWGGMNGSSNSAYSTRRCRVNGVKGRANGVGGRKQGYKGPPPQTAMVDLNPRLVVMKPTAPEFEGSMGELLYGHQGRGDEKNEFNLGENHSPTTRNEGDRSENRSGEEIASKSMSEYEASDSSSMIVPDERPDTEIPRRKSSESDLEIIYKDDSHEELSEEVKNHDLDDSSDSPTSFQKVDVSHRPSDVNQNIPHPKLEFKQPSNLGAQSSKPLRK